MTVDGRASSNAHQPMLPKTNTARNRSSFQLSIPYEKGWTLLLNGEEVEPELFGGTFMALELTPGDYELSMQYVPHGKYAGIVISVVSICTRVGQQG